ncbi:hypothetical protein Adi01nite_27230 [Amorphoplanes digitatis]|nr:hypothetical protein Adi01nite_27230 [Actinoplanes digitatis]
MTQRPIIDAGPGGTVGSITLASTLTVLERAVGTTHIGDKAQLREIYRRLRNLDDGLPPIEKTALLTTTRWQSGAQRTGSEQRDADHVPCQPRRRAQPGGPDRVADQVSGGRVDGQ